MKYIQIIISVKDAVIRDILIALLSNINFEGFEERENELLAFIPEKDFSKSLLEEVLASFQLSFTCNEIAKTNWNKEWEQNFQPVTVAGFCTVRADFHAPAQGTPYEIIITPKMSFGTGHHATTQLMMRIMQQLDFNHKKVLDFGTGTGILAILAEKLGAGEIYAVDNEEWAYENAIENAGKNNAVHINMALGSLENINEENFDIILANINRHILLQYMDDLYKKLDTKGHIIMSGLLISDEPIIVAQAEKSGFHLTKKIEMNNWIALHFRK